MTLTWKGWGLESERSTGIDHILALSFSLVFLLWGIDNSMDQNSSQVICIELVFSGGVIILDICLFVWLFSIKLPTATSKWLEQAPVSPVFHLCPLQMAAWLPFPKHRSDCGIQRLPTLLWDKINSLAQQPQAAANLASAPWTLCTSYLPSFTYSLCLGKCLHPAWRLPWVPSSTFHSESSLCEHLEYKDYVLPIFVSSVPGITPGTGLALRTFSNEQMDGWMWGSRDEGEKHNK